MLLVLVISICQLHLTVIKHSNNIQNGCGIEQQTKVLLSLPMSYFSYLYHYSFVNKLNPSYLISAFYILKITKTIHIVYIAKEKLDCYGL